VDSDDDVSNLSLRECSLQDLARQINLLGSSVPKRLQKFQSALEEKSRVQEAKTKQLIKKDVEKAKKIVQENSERIEKLKKGI